MDRGDNNYADEPQNYLEVLRRKLSVPQTASASTDFSHLPRMKLWRASPLRHFNYVDFEFAWTKQVGERAANLVWKDALAWQVGVQQHVVWRLTGCTIYACVALQPLEQRLQPAAAALLRQARVSAISS